MKKLRIINERLSLLMAAICVVLFTLFTIANLNNSDVIKSGLEFTYFQSDLLVLIALFLTITFYRADGTRMFNRLISLFGSITLLINEVMFWLTKNQWDNSFCAMMIISITGFSFLTLSYIRKRFHLIYRHSVLEIFTVILLTVSVVCSLLYGSGSMLYVIVINFCGIMLAVFNLLENKIQKEKRKQEKRRNREI